MKTADFGTITCTDSTKQVTYKGWSIDDYVQDQAAGETKVENVGQVRFVAKDYSVILVVQGNEQYLSHIDGKM